MLPYAPVNRPGALSAEDSYAQISELSDINKNNGLSKNSFVAFVRAIVNKVLSYVSDDKQYAARDIMRQLVNNNRLTHDEGIRLLSKLRECAHEKDKGRFFFHFNHDGHLFLKIDLSEHLEETSNSLLSSATSVSSIEEEVTDTEHTAQPVIIERKDRTDLQLFSLSFALSESEWCTVKQNNPELCKSEESTGTSLQSSIENSAHNIIASGSGVVGQKPNQLSVLTEPLPAEIEELFTAMEETTDKSSKDVHYDEEKDYESICAQIKQFKDVKEKVKESERNRFKIELNDTNQIVLTIHLDPFFGRPTSFFNRSTTRNRSAQRGNSLQRSEAKTCRSVALNRDVMRKLIDDGVLKEDEIIGWKNTQQLFNTLIENLLSTAIGEANHCSDIDALIYQEITEAKAKNRKISACVEAVKESLNTGAMQVAMAEWGHDSFSLEDVIKKLENTKTFEFLREPATEDEKKQTGAYAYRGEFYHLFSEDITGEVIARLKQGQK